MKPAPDSLPPEPSIVNDLQAEVLALSEEAKDREQQLVDLLQDYTDRNLQLVSAQHQIITLTQRVLAHEEAAKVHSSHVGDLYRSTSWRMTAPLRRVSLLVQDIKYSIKVFREVLAADSSFLKALWQAFRAATMSDEVEAAEVADHSPKTSDVRDYKEWIRRFDTLDSSVLALLKAESEAMTDGPLVSVIMPTYNANLDWLDQVVRSVQQQLYPKWELCIADDASTNPAVRPYLERLCSEDNRIKVVFRGSNGHISAATNSAIALATGDWITFVDHDDLLPAHALLYMVKALRCNPQAKLLYSDEDKIDDHGKRYDPYFKCDWNQDLFYSHNLVTHLAFYSSELIHEVGGLRDAYAGAQDYDLVLRVTEKIRKDQIVHVPFILYHWRAHAGSTATADLNIKPYAMLAGERSLNDHFKRIGVNAKAQFMGHGYRVRHRLPHPAPKVSIIIPTRNKVDLVRVCVESIREKSTYKNYEILLMDNGSDDPEALAYFSEQAKTENFRVIRDDSPFSYSAINNLGASQANGEVLCFLNNDIEVIAHDWMEELVSQAWRPGIGAVGAKLLYPNTTIQHAGVVLGIGGWAGHAHKGFSMYAHGYVGRATLASNFSAVTGACMAVQKKHFDQVGGFDDVNLKVACNDVDLCLRLMEAGLRNLFTPYAVLFHHESATRGYEDTDEKKARFQKEVDFMWKRWPQIMGNDPAYSPYLSIDHEDFGLAWPPRVSHSDQM